jgi:hypothetical protein
MTAARQGGEHLAELCERHRDVRAIWLADSEVGTRVCFVTPT